MEEQKEFYMRKLNACLLGRSKVVYAKEDEKDTIIIRNLYEEGNPNAKIFGLRKAEFVKDMFYSMMSIF